MDVKNLVGDAQIMKLQLCSGQLETSHIVYQLSFKVYIINHGLLMIGTKTFSQALGNMVTGLILIIQFIGIKMHQACSFPIIQKLLYY